MLDARDPIREDVIAVLRQMISLGALSPGRRLKEISLAEELGVGRTPVREALLIMERDGYVVAEPNKGCSVASITAAQISDAYSVCGALEALAIKRTPKFTPDHIAELDQLNEKLLKARNKTAKHKYDTAWHEALCKRSDGQYLANLLENARAFSRCFDGGQRRGIVNAERTVTEHDAITRALSADDRAKATRLIEEHWAGGVTTVIDWLTINDQIGRDPKIV